MLSSYTYFRNVLTKCIIPVININCLPGDVARFIGNKESGGFTYLLDRDERM